MKTKNLFITLGLALTVGAGVVAGVALSRGEAVKVGAYDDGTTYYYLTGKFDGTEHWTDYIAAPSDGTNAGVLLNQQLKAGDTFKFKLKNSWDNALGFAEFNSGAGAYNAFCYQNGDSNAYCGVTGTYNFYIYNDNGNMKVSAEFADSNTATYSYVLTSDSELGYTYLYKGSQELRSWGSSPAVNGQAWNIKFTYSAYDYYGLYRIDDRILAGWTTLIMKSSGSSGTKQSADITRTAGNKQELYLCGDSVVTKAASTNEYKAVEFLYDLVSHRGAATYDNYGFAYSICATSPEDAYKLVGRYDGFASGVVTILNSASLFTYNVEGEYGEADANKAWADVSDMVDALRPIAAKYTPGLGAKTIFGYVLEGSNNYTWVIAVIGVASLVAVGGFFFIRKRKENN